MSDVHGDRTCRSGRACERAAALAVDAFRAGRPAWEYGTADAATRDAVLDVVP